jgi:tRNA (cytosine38-C5)-methyltransferase
MSFALRGLNLPLELRVTSMDINTTANQVHVHNFPKDTVLERNLNALHPRSMEGLDMVMMSPPCQPFTRLGLKRDVSDNRSNSFVHIMEQVLPKTVDKPKGLLVENVKGFEESEARDIMVKTLTKTGYKFKEYLISPQDLNISNSRLRYYLIARLESLDPTTHVPEKKELSIETSLPSLDLTTICTDCRLVLFPETAESVINPFKPSFPENSLQSYLEATTTDLLEEHLIPDKVLLKYSHILDIVDNKSRSSCCFTRGYAHLVQGTGSVLQTNSDLSYPQVYANIQKWEEGEDTTVGQERVSRLRELGLRYFTPREVANLMSFPPEFGFPSNVTKKQKYKLLGNSVNVQVVSFVLRLLFIL